MPFRSDTVLKALRRDIRVERTKAKLRSGGYLHALRLCITVEQCFRVATAAVSEAERFSAVL